jgi:hypothetical protein
MQLRMTATPVGAVTFLKASSKPFLHALLLCDGGNPRSSFWFRQWRCYGVVPSLEALYGLHKESQVDSWS